MFNEIQDLNSDFTNKPPSSNYDKTRDGTFFLFEIQASIPSKVPRYLPKYVLLLHIYFMQKKTAFGAFCFTHSHFSKSRAKVMSLPKSLTPPEGKKI